MRSSKRNGTVRLWSEGVIARAASGFCLLAILLSGCVSDGDDARELYAEKVLADVPFSEDRPDDGHREIMDRIEADSERLEAAPSITLSDCFRLTLARSEDLRARGEQLLQARELEAEAIGDLLPKVFFNYRYARDSDAVRFGGRKIQPRDTTEMWFSANQPIFDAEILATLEASGVVSRLEELNLRTERDSLLYAVAAAFFDVLALEEDLAALEASHAADREFLRVLEVLFSEGEILEERVIAARALVEESEAALIQCDNDRAAARNRLRGLIGVDRLPGELVDNYEMTYSPGLIPDLVERAWRTRSDMEASRAAIDLARAQRTAELDRYLPTVDLEMRRWLHREGEFAEDIDWTLALRATWPLIDFGSRDAAYSRALSVVRQRELELGALRRQVRVDVEDAVLAFRTLDAAVVSLEKRKAATQAALDQAVSLLEAEEIIDLDLLAARSAHRTVEGSLERLRLARKQAGLKIRLVVGDLNLSGPMERVMKEQGE